MYFLFYSIIKIFQSSDSIIEKIAYETSHFKGQPINSNIEQQIQYEANGTKLMLITLFCRLIRKEYCRLVLEHAMLAKKVYDELRNTLLCIGNESNASQDVKALIGGLCSALAAVGVRTSTSKQSNEGIMNIIDICQSSIAASMGMLTQPRDTPPFSSSVALKLLSQLVDEAQIRNDVTTKVIGELLQSVAEQMLNMLHVCVSRYIQTSKEGDEKQQELLCLTLMALTKCAEAKMITLSSLASANNNGQPNFLSQLVKLLSLQPQQQRQWSTMKAEEQAEDCIIKASKALIACLENSSDYGMQSRQTAVASLLASISSTEFVIAPLKTADVQEWEDSIVSLSNLASTLAREEIETIALCQLPGCTDLIQLLLSLQSHPTHNVAMPVLDVWLALQDIPTSERHPTLAAPLYQQLVEIILNRAAYSPTFVSWEEEYELELSEFDEMRRLCTDVLVGAYYLLRSAYLETLANIVMEIDSQDWEVVEAALWCMSAVAREACARVKSVKNATSSGRESPVADDGEATGAGLISLLPSVCAGGADGIPRRHPLVLAGIVNFLGVYSSVWSASSPIQTTIEILSYLCASMSVQAATEAASKSIRLLLIASAGKLIKTDITGVLTQCMEAALATNNETAMLNVAEGCARVGVQIRDTSKARTTLSSVTMPTVQRARFALSHLDTSTVQQGSGHVASQMDEAIRLLASYLGVLRTIIRFCDGSKMKEGEAHVLTDVLTSSWPILNDVSNSSICRSNEAVIDGLLGVHSQLLSVVPALIAPHFNDLITFVVKAYEEQFTPSALQYVSSAVETFDIDQSIALSAGIDENSKEQMFNQLLSHICQCTFQYVTTTKPPSECPQLIKVFFEMVQRYLMFAPGALCQCSEFNKIFELAVACLSECKGEVESTRACLTFISQLIGWKYLRLSNDKVAKMTQMSATIDSLLAQNGEVITKACVGGVCGNLPQFLWPACQECLFSIILHISSSTQDSSGPNPLLQSWLKSALTDSSIAKSQDMTLQVIELMINILCSLAKENTKSICKMAMMDIAKISKGEASPDVLQAYSSEGNTIDLC